MQLKCTNGIQNMLVSDNNSHSKVSVKVSILLISIVAAVVELQGPGREFQCNHNSEQLSLTVFWIIVGYMFNDR